MITGPLSGLLRLISTLACLIMLAYFVIFVFHQTSVASTHQQEELGATTAHSTGHGSESTVHRYIDEAATKLASPFSSITAGSTSQWVIHGVNTGLALLLYGFVLGFIARLIRIRF